MVQSTYTYLRTYIHIFTVLLQRQCFLVHGQVTIIFVVSVCLFVCAAIFDPISIKLGHMLLLCPLEYRGCTIPGGWVAPKNLYV